MGKCIQCGSEEGIDYRFAHVTTASERLPEAHGQKPMQRITQTITRIEVSPVCPACARRAKRKWVLTVIPLALGATLLMTVLSWFTVRPGRNLRQEFASYPVVIPIVAAVGLGIALFSSLRRKLPFYAADVAHKQRGEPPESFLLPLDRRFYVREGKPLRSTDITSDTPVKCDGLCDALIPVMEGAATEEQIQALVGESFSIDRPAR